MGKAERKRSQQQRREQAVREATIRETTVTVCATPPTEDGRRLVNELHLLKSALLYADRVELLSPSSSFARTLKPFLHVTEENVLEQVSRMPPGALRRLGVGTDFGPGVELRKVRRKLREFDRLAEDDPDRIAIMKDWRPVALEMHQTANDYFAQTGSYELEMAFERDDVELLDVGFDMDDEVSVLIETFRNSMLAALEDSGRAILVDPLGSEMMRMHPDRGSAYTGARARRASTGSGLIERLPTFPGASMEDILEARDELADGRVGYRNAVKELADKLISAPFDESLPDEIDELWHDSVEPALVGLRKRATATRIAYEAGKSLISSSAGQVGALAVTVTSIGSLTDLFPSAAAATTGGVNVAYAGVREALRARAEVRHYDLVYLHDVNRSLGDADFIG
ncbi:hypothetical protein [Brachybacterium paraconglomeratum]|uniref:hypothetical protein n=1 Tax=Brachybacterium paraconglomeratum TaxID=173362 RepID=UPI0022B05E09|nr:hypothetical protein [Brachybacterium paraconglomeratum]MCZ4327504.1 hypothetical protein [Brachybacterium paraconglomeratum]